MRRPNTVKALEELGRTRLSDHFFLRDFLFSDIVAIHGLANVPDDPELAIASGARLCEELLEPMQNRFGRIAIRSAHRSEAVNALGNELGESCARNEGNHAAHIWDRHDAEGRMDATVCVVVPAFRDVLQEQGDWRKLAWWIHDHLPYSSLYLFPKMWAVNIQWREQPERRIDSYAAPKGCLTKPGIANHHRSHVSEWRGIERAMLK